jgi:hypothetical protein
MSNDFSQTSMQDFKSEYTISHPNTQPPTPRDRQAIKEGEVLKQEFE